MKKLKRYELEVRMAWAARQPLPNSFRIDILFYRLHCSRHRTAQCKCPTFSENFRCTNFFFLVWRCTQRSACVCLLVEHILLAQHSLSAYQSFRELCAVILLNNKINSHIRWRQHINLLLCCCSCRLSSFVVSHYLCTQALVKAVFFGLCDVRHCGHVLPKKKRRQREKRTPDAPFIQIALVKWAQSDASTMHLSHARPTHTSNA